MVIFLCLLSIWDRLWHLKQSYGPLPPLVWQAEHTPLALPWFMGKEWVNVAGCQALVVWHCEHWPWK